MVDLNKFGCQSAEQTCTMVAQFKEMYEVSGGMGIFNLSEPEHLRRCIAAQRRLGEIAAFKGVSFTELVLRHSDEKTNNCPISVLVDEDSLDIPTLLK